VTVLTTEGLADALGCFWNAAIGAAHTQQEGMATAAIMAEGIAAVQHRLEEQSADDRIQKAIDMAVQHGGHDGAHHKDWVIDQMVRILAGDRYDQIVAEARSGEDGPETYDWEIGIAP